MPEATAALSLPRGLSEFPDRVLFVIGFVSVDVFSFQQYFDQRLAMLYRIK